MPPEFYYSDPRGIEEPAVLVSLPSNIRFGQVALAMSAEVGNPAMSTIEADDPFALYDFQGLRAFHVKETSAPSNNQIIGRFVIQDRRIGRGESAITSNARKWTIDLTDYNWHLGKRIHTDADANRPRESPGDRIHWLLDRAAHINLNDYGNVTYPTSPTLDAADYRGQRPTDVLADCAVEGQYNFWVDFNEAHGRPELFFMDPDAAGYTASLYISNHPYDVDGLTTFAPSDDAELTRSPSRIAFGVYLPYANGAVYVRKDSTGEQFAKIDQAAPMANVKSAARATRVANTFLDRNATESDRIRCSIVVPQAQVNDVRHGHLIGARFTHFPGYEDWSAFRVVQRAVAQEDAGGQDCYRIFLEMVPSDAAVPQPPYMGDAFGALLGNDGTTTAPNEKFRGTGDTEPAGWYERPNVGPITVSLGATLLTQTITTDAAMTVRLNAQIQYAVIIGGSGSMTVNIVSSSNGIIASGTASLTATGLEYRSGAVVVDLHDYAAAAGEVFTLQWGRDIVSGGFTDGTDNSWFYVGRGDFWFHGHTVNWVGP